jgi:type IV fimbrial biogenesis protein FimT
MHRNSRRVKGFNLIELMVVISIVSILATIGLPKFEGSIQSFQMKNKSSDLYHSIVLARSEAIKRATNITVCTINTAKTDCSGADGWEKGWIIKEVAGADPIISIHDGLSSDYTFSGSSTATSSITFTPSGNTINSGKVVLCYQEEVDEYTRTVSLNRFGKVTDRGVDRYTPSSCN